MSSQSTYLETMVREATQQGAIKQHLGVESEFRGAVGAGVGIDDGNKEGS
jgi:hypothetical protein